MRQWTIDAFASGPFKGNPACVVEPFDAWPTAGWMQTLAAENNQAETAYLLKTGDPARFGLLAGRFVGEGALLRFYVLHCVGLPLAAATLMAIHFWRVRKDGGISGPL